MAKPLKEVAQLATTERIKIDPQTKSVLKTVTERCKKEKDSNRLVVPLEYYEERASFYTGFSKLYITSLCNGKQSLDEYFTLSHCLMVRNLLLNFYVSKQVPNIKELHDMLLNSSTDLPSLSKFYEGMEILGYSCKPTVGGSFLLMEDPKITFERFFYLQKIIKYRGCNRNIYYIDVRLLDTNIDALKFKKPWETNYNIFSDYKGIVIFHIVSKSCGYEAGLFCKGIKMEDFNNWVLSIMIPVLQPSSAVVIEDNTFFRSMDQPITSRYLNKTEMLKRLNENGIPCNAQMHKAELFELLKKCPNPPMQQTIDGLIKAHGHEVLRLPRSLFELSLTTPLWEYIKDQDIFGAPPYELNALKYQVETALQSSTHELLSRFDDNIKKMEAEYFNLDIKIENALDSNFVLDADLNAMKDINMEINDCD